MRRIITAVSVALLLGMAGCQCCPKSTDCAATVVDHVADHGPKLDCLYSPCFDLTRIGMSDWCECKCSRWFCSGCCRKCD